MDYEKKYNEALERAKAYHRNELAGSKKEMMEYIFPELAESEDEKWLVGYFGSIKETVWIHRDITCEQILDWLEKQKEQVTDESDKVAAAYQLGRSDERKQKEQKPVEWEDIKDKVNIPYCSSEPEWSEEDEKMLTGIIERGSVQVPPYTTALREEQIEWLMNRLKSLRSCPKSSDNWKPSEEQMEAFRGYIEDFQARAEAAVGGWNNFDVMIRLYEQLKKL